MKYLWTEDTGAGLHFWKLVNQLFFDDALVVESKESNQGLLDALAEIDIKEDDKYYIAFDCVVDNQDIRNKYRMLKSIEDKAEGKIIILDMICFEYLILAFDKLVAWTGTGKTDKIKIREEVLSAIENHRINLSKIDDEKALQYLFQIEELYENGEMNYSEKDQMLKLAFRSYTGSDQFTLNKLYKLKSVVVQASRMVLQAVGRMCRTFVKSPNIYLFVESELLEKLYVGEINKRILSPEMKAIVSMRETIGKDYLPEENLMLNKAEKISSVGLWTIRRMLAKDWTVESMQLWERLRALVLQYPTASTYDWQNNEYLQKLYITSGEKRNQYIYSQYSDFNDVTIDFGNDKVAFKNSKRAKIKGNSDEVAIYEMSEKESSLQAILRYPGMKAHFEEMGYALKFEMNEYLLSPVLFHNIYKGALGEVAGKFILKRELGIELSPITVPEYFEFFDYKLSDDVYVDFKNWKFTYVQDRDEIRKDILRKLEAIGAKRVYIINVVSDKNYKPSAIVDQCLVEIPMLIREDGTVCYENLHMIRKEDFENVN